MKTLNDFKEELAIEQGWSCFKDAYIKMRDGELLTFSNQAAERYAEYRFQEGLTFCQTASAEAFRQGWNEAIEKSIEETIRERGINIEEIRKLKK